MKKKALLMMFAVSVASLADQTISLGDKGNGGDLCERRILEIRDDIESWINNDKGYLELDFKKRLTPSKYFEGMNNALTNSTVECVNEKIIVHKSEKTCGNVGKKIICNIDRFNNEKEGEQYRLVHHEFAGVAGIEVNNGEAESSYFLSSQISGFLQYELVKKLSLKKRDLAPVEEEVEFKKNAQVAKENLESLVQKFSNYKEKSREVFEMMRDELAQSQNAAVKEMIDVDTLEETFASSLKDKVNYFEQIKYSVNSTIDKASGKYEKLNEMRQGIKDQEILDAIELKYISEVDEILDTGYGSIFTQMTHSDKYEELISYYVETKKTSAIAVVPLNEKLFEAPMTKYGAPTDKFDFIGRDIDSRLITHLPLTDGIYIDSWKVTYYWVSVDIDTKREDFKELLTRLDTILKDGKRVQLKLGRVKGIRYDRESHSLIFERNDLSLDSRWNAYFFKNQEEGRKELSEATSRIFE